MNSTKQNLMYKEIIELVKKLGDQLPSLAGQITDIGIKKKWLTEKDLEIETELTNLIATFGKDHTVFAEELHPDFVENENVWIIDPISSTRSFITGFHHYAVVVSHLQKGDLQFAAVYDPSVKELFTAYKEKGAFLNSKRIEVSKRQNDFNFIFPVRARKPFTLKQASQLVEELTKIGLLTSIGSVGLHYCYVACGRANAAITLNKDVFPEFAGKLILEESGGKLTDFQGEELSINSQGIIASQTDLYGKLLEIVKTILD